MANRIEKNRPNPNAARQQALTNYILTLRQRAAALGNSHNVKVMIFRGLHTPGFDHSDSLIAEPTSANLAVPQDYISLLTIKVSRTFVTGQIDLVKILTRFAQHQQSLISASPTLDPANYTDLEMDLEILEDKNCRLLIKVDAVDAPLGKITFIIVYHANLTSLILAGNLPA
jgi:hypothetical protein